MPSLKKLGLINFWRDFPVQIKKPDSLILRYFEMDVGNSIFKFVLLYCEFVIILDFKLECYSLKFINCSYKLLEIDQRLITGWMIRCIKFKKDFCVTVLSLAILQILQPKTTQSMLLP